MTRPALALLVALLTAACGNGVVPPVSGTAPVESPSPGGEDDAVPDPRAVAAEALIPPGATSETTLYGEMNGVPPEEIVVHSTVPSEDVAPRPHLDVFSWDPGRRDWVRVFEASGFVDPVAGAGPMLHADPGISQSVPFLHLLDFAADGTLELAAGVQTFGASPGPLELWILSWPSEAFAVEFHRATERGGTLSAAARTVTLEAPVYGPDDPGCCPSETETVVIGWDPQAARIGVLERTVEEVPQG